MCPKTNTRSYAAHIALAHRCGSRVELHMLQTFSDASYFPSHAGTAVLGSICRNRGRALPAPNAFLHTYMGKALMAKRAAAQALMDKAASTKKGGDLQHPLLYCIISSPGTRFSLKHLWLEILLLDSAYTILPFSVLLYDNDSTFATN